MSTLCKATVQIETDRFRELRLFLEAITDAKNLLEPEQLEVRLNALDELDALIGGLDLDLLRSCPDSWPLASVEALQFQFETANERLYESMHYEIALRRNSRALEYWLSALTKNEKADEFHPGLGFDLLDEIVCGVLQLREPGEVDVLPAAEMTDYQPTPVRHILDLIRVCKLSIDDVFVDLGSGLGHVSVMVNILAGIRTLGVEIQPHYARSAQQTAQRLNLSGVRFVAQDAREADLSSGTVFYLFTPFTGSILTKVLHRLQQESLTRPIKVCVLGPSTRILQDQTWLRADQQLDTERVTLFESFDTSRQRRTKHKATSSTGSSSPA